MIKPSIVMLVYGEGGVGKTTFAATAPNPILGDCENGTKYFGIRGIAIDAALIESWEDMGEFTRLAMSPKYSTVIIDPIGELMEKLTRFLVNSKDRKMVQADGSPSMAGWGWLKKTMRDYVNMLRQSGKHVILVAHVEEVKDEDRLVKRPKLATKLSAELVGMVDVVGHMITAKDENGNDTRTILVDATSDRFIAKDRSEQLGKEVEPNFQKIIDKIYASKKWAKEETPKTAQNAPQAPVPTAGITNPPLAEKPQKEAVAAKPVASPTPPAETNSDATNPLMSEAEKSTEQPKSRLELMKEKARETAANGKEADASSK